MMRRRALITLLGATALTWPLAGRAQQPDPMRRIAVLVGNVASASEPFAQEQLRPFQASMRDAGWIEGKNIHVEYRFGSGDRAQLQRAASDLVASGPELIYAITTGSVEAVREKTSTIPIVFSEVADAIGRGFVASLARPGGNVTGFVVWEPATASKWVELLKEIAPNVNRIGIMFNPEMAPFAGPLIAEAERATGHDGSLVKYPVRDDSQIDKALAALGRKPRGGLVLIADAFTTAHMDYIIVEAARFQVPTMYTGAKFAIRRGGLISYAFAFEAHMRQPVTYINRILKGEKPANLPVQAPTKYELALNLKTAKALGLTIPPSLLQRADQVIE